MPHMNALCRSASLVLFLAVFASAGIADNSGADHGAQTAIPLEIGVEARAGNLQFPWSDAAPTSGTGAFPSDNFFWGGTGYLAAPLGEDASVRLGYETDPVLRNLVTGSIEFERGAARIAVGPFIGLLNSASSPFSVGLSTTIGLQWPGVAYASLRSAGGLSLGLAFIADTLNMEPQALAEIKAGFYVRNAIVSGIITSKRFCDSDSSGGLIIDSLTSYYLTIEAFKKNVPYTVLAKAGYEFRSKYYETSATADSLGSVNLGLEAGFDVLPGIALKGGLSTGIFVAGLDALSGRSPDAASFLFSASLGCVVKTGELRPSPRRAPKAEAQAASGPSEEGPAAASGSAPIEAEPGEPAIEQQSPAEPTSD
jgi:hypothetical protein